MKRKIGEIHNKPIVTGDKNLVTKNEVHESTLGEGGNLNDEEFFIFLEWLPQNEAVSLLNDIDKFLAPISSVLSTACADSMENSNNHHLFKFHTSDILNPMTSSESESILGFSYKKIPIISKFIAGNRGFNWCERKGNLLERITVDGEKFYGDELVEDTVNFIKLLYSPDSSEFIKIVSKEEYENYYITNKKLVEKDNI